jgi:hypothetical protein
MTRFAFPAGILPLAGSGPRLLMFLFHFVIGRRGSFFIAEAAK